ncbi:amidase-like [Antedon mediterranea]|uniref:amidase-like n=1 Tax=Antedon mediterranea TaxID=105859 RepID=UPI003AF4B7AA
MNCGSYETKTVNDDDLYCSRPVQVPSINKVEELSKRAGFDLTDNEVKEYREVMKGIVEGFSTVEKLNEPSLPVKYLRLPGYRPSEEENYLNAWSWRTEIQGAIEGPLHGKRLAIKDNVAVYGVPMTAGSWTLQGYMPEFDATVVTRILDAGGVIKGKANCDDLCRGCTGYLAAKGPVLNPHNNEYIAGGSSAGSAVLVATGEVDMAIGCDQGGSIRYPASCCGIVGLKPSYGLVPYTGVQCSEPSLDHLGPMAGNVYDCALLLEVIAGYDNGLDARQPTNISKVKYTAALDSTDLSSYKIGILKEGFEHSNSDARVNKLIRESVGKFKQVGAELETVTVPMHKHGIVLETCITFTGEYDTVIKGGGNGSGRRGFYSTSMTDAVSRGIKAHSNDLQPNLKLAWMLADYMKNEYNGRYYGKAQNLVRALAAEFDKVFKDVDVIAMPTIPFPPKKIPKKGLSVKDCIELVSGLGSNARSFSLTGHPALSINAGFIDGLPIGMMLVAKMFDEKTLFKVAYAFEKLNE